MDHNNYYNYNTNIPNYDQQDWGSMARQWVTLQTFGSETPVNNYNLNRHQILPPPPPPPPPPTVTPLMNINPYSYFNDNKFEGSQNQTNRSYNGQYYEPSTNPSYNYEENNTYETFDYNHDSTQFYDNYNYPESNSYSQIPYENVPDKVNNAFNVEIKPPQINPPSQKLFPVDESLTKPVIVPITAGIYNYPNTATSVISNTVKPTGSIPTSNKGLPAWIIDDMKKMREKERKQNVISVDLLKDNPTESKCDEEGDIVMEDIHKEIELEGSGKRISSPVLSQYQITTEADIDDVSLHGEDEDEDVDKIDYASKSLGQLIEMIDENEIDDLKFLIIRDSLTGVMKDVTDKMIYEVSLQCFKSELTNMSKPESNPQDFNGVTSKTLNSPKHESPNLVVGTLIGLDAYASEDDEEEEAKDEPDVETNKGSSKNEIKSSSDIKKNGNIREKWCSNKKKSRDTEKIKEEIKPDASLKTRETSKISSKDDRKKVENDKETISHKSSSSHSKKKRHRSTSKSHRSSHHKSGESKYHEHKSSKRSRSRSRDRHNRHHKSSKDDKHRHSSHKKSKHRRSRS